MVDPINYLGAMGGLQGISNPGGSIMSGVMAGEQMQAQRQQQALQAQMVQQKVAEAQRKAEREAQYQQKVQEFIVNPTAQGAADLQILFPEQREAVKAAWDTQGEELAQTNLRQLGSVFSSLGANRPDLAKASLEDRIAAEKEAGRPTQDYEALLNMIEKNPKEALGFAGFLLSSVVGPEKYASVLEQVRLSQKGGGEDFTLAPGSVRYDAEGNVVASSPYRPEIIRGPDGSIIEYTPGGGGSGSGTPRGLRNNNPGNIKDGPWAKSQPGYKGSDGTFAIFDTPDAGATAQQNLLARNYLGKGVDTPLSIVRRYAPEGENSTASVQNYAAHIARRLGIGVNDKVPQSRVAELQRAMAEFENGTAGGGSRVIAEGAPKYEYRVNNGKLQRRRIN